MAARIELITGSYWWAVCGETNTISGMKKIEGNGANGT